MSETEGRKTLRTALSQALLSDGDKDKIETLESNIDKEIQSRVEYWRSAVEQIQYENGELQNIVAETIGWLEGGMILSTSDGIYDRMVAVLNRCKTKHRHSDHWDAK